VTGLGLVSRVAGKLVAREQRAIARVQRALGTSRQPYSKTNVTADIRRTFPQKYSPGGLLTRVIDLLRISGSS